MVNAFIVSVGNEILSGQTVDSNAAWLAGRLLSVGMPVAGVCVVGDDLTEISEAVGRGANKADVVLITGGLGPTDDDVTREALAEYMGVKLNYHEELLAGIKAFFDKRNMSMAECNRRQAYLPAGAKAIINETGTAPGVMAEHGGKLFVCMPGVPVEMKRMFDDHVIGEIEKRADGGLVIVKKLRCFGMGESTLVEKLGDMMERGRNPLVNCTVHGSVITLHIVARAETKKAADDMIKGIEKLLRGTLGQLVFGENDDTLAGVVGRKLTDRGLKISVAESCTGGLIGKMLTDGAGASNFFEYGWITYSNQAKVSQLGVDIGVIERFGAVSEDVAVMMARGARMNTKADIGVGVTGIAGPSGGSDDKPVGTVYIAVDNNGVCEVEKHVFSHGRAFIRRRTALTALNMVRLGLID